MLLTGMLSSTGISGWYLIIMMIKPAVNFAVIVSTRIKKKRAIEEVSIVGARKSPDLLGMT